MCRGQEEIRCDSESEKLRALRPERSLFLLKGTLNNALTF